MPFLSENYRRRFSNFKIAEAEIGGLKRIQLENIVPFAGNDRIDRNGYFTMDKKNRNPKIPVFLYSIFLLFIFYYQLTCEVVPIQIQPNSVQSADVIRHIQLNFSGHLVFFSEDFSTGEAYYNYLGILNPG